MQSNASDDIISNEHNNIEESEENEQIRDSSGWSRRENNDSESGAGAVQETDGGVPGRSQEIGWQQTGRESLPNSEDNRRITSEKQKSLKTTAIKTEDGSPKEVYHFTDNMEFETFAKGDIGFHFGSEQQAASRGENKGKTGRIIKTFLDIKNPLHISTDIMNWKPMPLAFRLSVDGMFIQPVLKSPDKCLSVK